MKKLFTVEDWIKGITKTVVDCVNDDTRQVTNKDNSIALLVTHIVTSNLKLENNVIINDYSLVDCIKDVDMQVKLLNSLCKVNKMIVHHDSVIYKCTLFFNSSLLDNVYTALQRANQLLQLHLI